MDVTFETIGLEVPSEKAFNYLAERAGDQGEPTQLTAARRGAAWPLLETGRGAWKSGLCFMNRERATSFMRIVVRVFARATRSASAHGR